MKILFTITTLFLGQILFGQNFSYPTFKKSAKKPSDFIEPKWFLKDSTEGDLNGDGIADLVMVLELKDTIEEVRPDSSINNGSPRVLLIAFRNPKTEVYNLVLQNNTFIIRYGEGGMDPEAYGKVSISNKVLQIFFGFIRGQATYKFRFQNDDFYLIGTNTGGVSGGQYENWDINFSTKKAKHTWGDISNEKTKEKILTITLVKLKKLQDLHMLFTWEVLPYVYI